MIASLLGLTKLSRLRDQPDFFSKGRPSIPSVATSGVRATLEFAVKLIASAGILLVALAFVYQYVVHYFLNYNQAEFTAAASNHWILRRWLLVHMTGGTVALLSGPFQFWTGFRKRYARLHRWTGYFFLGGVAVGSVCAFRMAIVTTLGWDWGVALIALGLAWVTTTAMAYYAILRGRISIHKEWMVRAYVVTFSFVTYRSLGSVVDFLRLGPTSHLEPGIERDMGVRL